VFGTKSKASDMLGGKRYKVTHLSAFRLFDGSCSDSSIPKASDISEIV
jgi:hypothetical protein